MTYDLRIQLNYRRDLGMIVLESLTKLRAFFSAAVKICHSMLLMFLGSLAPDEFWIFHL
jgi:hypothetical protein